MEGNRSQAAMARIQAALARIDTACEKIGTNSSEANPKVMSLINKHESLREEVAGTVRDLDKLIAELEG